MPAWSQEQLRQHITYAVSRISAENEIRHNLMQAELDRRFAEYQRQLDQRFEASGDAVTAALTASDKAVQAALASSKEAVTKSEGATEKRFDSVNEFRQTLSDQTKTFVTADKFEGLTSQMQNVIANVVPRAENEAKWGALTDKFATSQNRTETDMRVLTSRLDQLQGEGAGKRESHGDRNDSDTLRLMTDYNKTYALRSNIGIAIAALSSIIAIVAVIVVALVH